MKSYTNLFSHRSSAINLKQKFLYLMSSFRCTQRKKFLWLTLLSSLSLSSAVFADCDQVGGYIVNLSQDLSDLGNTDICTSRLFHSEIRECIADQIRVSLPDDCQRQFDIFVPGTNAEHGAWKQFNRMFKTDTNRAHLVLAYDDARTIEGLLNFDAAKYDQGVKDARLSLILLLDALNEYFNVEQIRVFGHSKGSHSVALVADDSSYEDVEFYAFAQPGRTDVNIDSNPDIVPGKLGTPGYIEKLSDNLVGITWQNDEVQYYVGDGENGLSMPEIWSFPGYIWQENTGFGTFGTNYLHIDHHNNYGGFYTDGNGSTNDWREGGGTVSDNFPYCATGDQLWAEDSDECKKQNSTKAPYFWGTPECVAEAFKMMRTQGNVDDQYKIGYSGPRQPGSCKQSSHLVRVKWDMRYRYDLPDKDCVFHLRFGFTDLITGQERDSFEVEGTTENDQQWLTIDDNDLGELFVPIHMRLTVRAWLEEDSQGFPFPDCENITESEAWISKLSLTFDHPGTGESNKEQTIIGQDEGRGSIANIHRWDNVAWEQPNLSNEEIRMYYSGSRNAIKIETVIDTDANDEGNFQKRVHLLD